MKIEIVTKPGVKPRWRLRDRDGSIVPLRPGKVYLPRGTVDENRRIRDAVDSALAKMAARQ